MRTEHVTACPLDCPDTCSLTATVDRTIDGGRLVKVDAGPGNPLTDGWICQKVKHHPQRVYAPERVRTPLVRTGPKGAGEFRAASWDEALDLFVAKLRDAEARFGPESVVPHVYNSSAPTLQDEVGTRLWRRFGASRVDHTVCAATHGAAWRAVYGDMLSADPRDVVHAELVIVWGANPTVSNVHLGPLITRAQRERGAKVVVVDPRATATAKRADAHLAIRPGTDVVLALAITRQLQHTNVLDHAFLARHTVGLDALLAAAAPWTLARAAQECGIAADDIAQLAADLATIRPAFLRVGWGLERNRNGGSACAAVFALPLLTGQLGHLGAGVMASLSGAVPLAYDWRDPDTPPERRRGRHFNMNTFGAALCDRTLDPPIAVLFVQGSNLAVTSPAQTKVLDGLGRDDIFTVVHDQVLTDTARYADVVLPAPTHFELDDLAASYGAYALQPVRPVIDRVGEAWSNNDLAAELARRLGYDVTRYTPARADALERSLTDDGTYDEARELRAAASTVQLRDTFPSFDDRRARLAAIPGLGAPRYQPLDDPYPLTLITPATARTINSMFGEFQSADPALHMHPDDAAVRGLIDGATVTVHNDLAAITTTVRVDAEVRPGVVTMPKGLWCRTFPGGLTANALVPDSLSDLAGGACFNDARVEVEPA